MDDIGEVGLLTPPEDPQLPGIGLEFAAPHAQQVGLHAAHEAAQNRVVLGRGRDHRPVLPAAAEAVATPFNARQLRLRTEESRFITQFISDRLLSRQTFLFCYKFNISVVLAH